MTPVCSSRAAWVGVLACALILQCAQSARAQKEWDPGIPKDLFQNGNPPERLRAAKCKECNDQMAALQAALDDWYAMRLAEIDKSLSGSDKPPKGTQDRLEKEKKDLLKGLGDPKDKGAEAKEKQKKNSDKDFQDYKKKHGKGKNPKDILKEKIAQALKDLQECEEKCPTSEVTTTPTPTPTEVTTGTPTPTPTPEKPVEAEQPPALPKPITLPTPPPCFNTEDEREAFLKKWDPIAANERVEARKAREIVNLKYKNDTESAWAVYWRKKQKIHETSADDLQKIIDDAADKTKTPVPCPKKGGGVAKTPTPKPGKPKKAPRIATGGGNISFIEENPCLLIAENKIAVDITGTGETIGHVADAKITNLTDEPIEFTIPPGVLESRSRKNQDYEHLHPIDVVLQPHESKDIPLDGICLDRHKPPVEKGVGGDLAFNDCDPDPRISREDSDRMYEISESVDRATDELEDDGQLKKMPYKDPKKRKDIVKQWATWVRMSEVTGDPPPTKDDLKKVVEKQVGKVPPDKQKKIDEGIDTIFEKIELATKKAKDEQKEDESTGAEQATPGGNTYEISDNTPTPQPGTQEKKKKEGKKKKDKKKKYPPEIQKWLDDYDTWIEWASKRNMAEYKYLTELKKWALEHSPHYKELNDAVQKALQKISDANKNGGKPTQEDWDNLKKAQQELEKNEKELGKDFQKTEPGKALYKEFVDAEDIANNSKKRADESGKGIDEEVKKEILEKERD